jgi:predicted transcriptional regulator
MYKLVKRTPNYVPSFRGKHNATRCKTWLVLYNCYLGHKRGLTLRELAQITGISYGSLSVCLVKWVKWRYIGYQPHPNGRQYCILKRGRDWLKRWQETMPLEKYIDEIEEHQLDI